jgi:hypothetical protein
MKPIEINVTPEAIASVNALYHTTRDVRLRTRAQIVLLAAEQGLSAAEIAVIVRQSEQMVCNR